MTAISDIDENGINHNLKVRYKRDQIYVSFSDQTNLNNNIMCVFVWVCAVGPISKKSYS